MSHVSCSWGKLSLYVGQFGHRELRGVGRGHALESHESVASRYRERVSSKWFYAPA